MKNSLELFNFYTLFLHYFPKVPDFPKPIGWVIIFFFPLHTQTCWFKQNIRIAKTVTENFGGVGGGQRYNETADKG